MRIVRVDCRWRVLGFGHVVYDCLEGLAYRNGYRVDAVCEALGLSKSHFREIFQRDVGLTPKEWMKWERMVVARRMLVWGVRPKDAAMELGFSDIDSFNREFRSVHGVKPKYYLELRLPDDA